MINHHQLLFWRQFIEHFAAIGAVLPSSPALGRAGAAYLATPRNRPVRVLEAGAGTGSFTCEAIPYLQPGDRFDVVEINPALTAYLQQRLQRGGLLNNPHADIRILNGDLLHFPINVHYDFIICSLPFSNFPTKMVEELLAALVDRLAPGGVFSYVKYAMLGQLKYWLSNAEAQGELDEKQAVFNKYARQYQIERHLVLPNVPPTWVYYWQKPADSPTLLS